MNICNQTPNDSQFNCDEPVDQTLPQQDGGSLLIDNKGTHKLLHKIIEIWSRAIVDKNPTIRLFTLGITACGFFSLVLVLMASIEGACHIAGKSEETINLSKYLKYFLMNQIIMIIIGIPAIIRLSNKSSAQILHEGFDEVYKQRKNKHQNDEFYTEPRI